MLTATPLYAGLITLLFLWLSFRVVGSRRSQKISVGDGGDALVMQRMRAQANCAEYAPLGIILLALAELQGMPVWLVHVFGLMLLAGRVVHAYGFSVTPQVFKARVWGMYLTIAMLAFMALANIFHALF
ncbi:hypothetical protein EDD52_101268 [Primorskyibacter sedentarius]|uniref:MAPEG family protein n=1 Tax=Primorskyibacter sedentarius TaxID=745311 RepID=A0A4R3JLH7_9RHOB|nr:MAPEG family protein [Primorskyibacter sedentarius]TCS67173.1 hypothetical protein EDD52_101268 [Primorskyibacter sedentarius]